MRAMKDSGIKWIGEIPQEWKTPPLRSRYSFSKGLSITKADLSDTGVCVISYGQIHSKENVGVSIRDSLIRHIPSDHSSLVDTAKAHIGDLIFADTSEDLQGCGNCVFVDRDDSIYAGYHTMLLRPKQNTQGRYYAYLFAADAWRAQVRAKVSGVKLFSITQDILKSTILLEPSAGEQERIVNYLDTKCAEIDALIAAKEKTNALLKERRQSIIYEAVTKGLDPTAPMKDSGIEWIGMIPEGWDVKKTKYCFSIIAGATPKTENSEYWDGDIAWITPADYKTEDVFVSAGRKSISDAGLNSCATTLIPANSLIFSKRAPVGLVAINSQPLCTNQGCLSCVPDEGIDAKFYYYAMSSCTSQYELLATGTTFKEISAEAFANFVLPAPEYDVQKRIADYLDTECAGIDAVVHANESTIEKLKEYRQSVIYEAVTGKIEV